MPPNITPLLTRLKKRFIRMPRATGVFLRDDEEDSGTLAKSGEKIFTTSSFCGAREFSASLSSAVRPHVLCICQGENRTRQNRELLKLIHNEYDTVIFASMEKVMPSLGLSGLKQFIEWFSENGLEIKPRRDEAACAAALSAFTGFFYLADEFEYDAESGSVIPLLFECHELYSFLRLVPYGEVTTFGEVAKVLGLQWSEARVMSELARLPAEAEVFGHRVIHRDGRLSDAFPGGIALQKELLKWELVPFASTERVDLKKALWSRQKYRPLTNYLKHTSTIKRFVEINFSAIEKITGAPLPRAARRLGSWWQDDKPHSWIWKDAGCKITNVNMQTQTVVFSATTDESLTYRR